MKKSLIALMLAALTLSTAGCSDTGTIASNSSSTESGQTVGEPYHYARVRLEIDSAETVIYAVCLNEHAFLDRSRGNRGDEPGLTRYPEMDEAWCDPDHGQIIQHEQEAAGEKTEEEQG